MKLKRRLESGGNHKARRRNIILVAAISLVCSLGIYCYRLYSADLLTRWHTSSSILTSGHSKYYVINSDSGTKTYVPKFLLNRLGYADRPSREAISSWELKIRGFEPEFSANAVVAGWLDRENIVFTVNTGDYFYHVYKYNVRTGRYEVITSRQSILQCLAGEGKIFYRTPVEYDSPDGAIPVSEAYEPIYLYRPGTAEAVKIGEYMVFPRNLELVMVLK